MTLKPQSWLDVGLVISKSLVQFPAGALWSVLGQDRSFHIAPFYPAAKWVPSINKAVLRACALYAASCSEYPPGDRNGLCVYRPARGGRSCELFGGYKYIHRIPLPIIEVTIVQPIFHSICFMCVVDIDYVT